MKIELEGDETLIGNTKSLCPKCVEEKNFSSMTIPAVIYKKGNEVWMAKKCEKHGLFKSVYWEDYEMYKKASTFQDSGVSIGGEAVKKGEASCPIDCGLCQLHKSNSALVNIVLTNRCDLSCPYCFFYHKKTGYVYEPTIEQVKYMIKSILKQSPIKPNAVQFTGGEPTIRDDLPEIIKLATDMGIGVVIVNTNGIRISRDVRFLKKIKDAGCGLLYLSFDGVSPETNPKNYSEFPNILENCRKTGVNVVLVPTIIRGKNDHEIGNIIKIAVENIDIIRGVNFQPVSFVGKMSAEEINKQRITIPAVIKKIEEQTNAQIKKSNFYPVPFVSSLSDYLEAVNNEPCYRFSAHFACGMATYVYKSGNKIIPITEIIDVEGIFKYLKDLSNDISSSKLKLLEKHYSKAKLILNLRKFIKNKKTFSEFGMDILLKLLATGSYDALGVFHRNSLFIGMMHFQDPYNWDIERVKRCVIHYVTPDGRIIPFCTFNVIPELYRDKIQKEFSVPLEKWKVKKSRL